MAEKTKSKRTTENSEETFTLTSSEQLLLWRRRKEWKQGHAAAYYGVSPFIYKITESGRTKGFNIGNLPLGEIKDYEKCLILRRRAKLTQREIANQIGCSVYWLRLQETGCVAAPKLIEYWNNTK